MPRLRRIAARLLRGCSCNCQSCCNSQCGMCLSGPAH